jgi:two-component system heavy metal sensor histidine kinase CusS
MPSIRRSLIAYFLILLLVALGGVGVLVDRFAELMMRAREVAEAKRIDQEYEFRCQQTERKFNEELEQQATDLGRELRWKEFVLSIRMRDRDRELEDWEKRNRMAFSLLPAVGFGGAWPAAVSQLVAQNPRVRGPVYWAAQRAHSDEVIRQSFAEEVRQQSTVDAKKQHPKYFQFHFPPRGRRMIPNPNPDSELPPIPVEDLNKNAALLPMFDDVTVGGEPVRRVILRSPLITGPIPRIWPDLGRPGGPQLLPGQPDRGADPLPFVYVQAGRPKTELDARLAVHEENRQKELAGLADDTRKAMGWLRTQLAVIGVVMLIAVPTGAWLLVGRGVAPIRHLSDAVSRVSEKDFRLPVGSADLSRELVPIHDRLTHTLDALRRAFEREKQAVADISHELKTPIAALLTSVGVSLRKPRTAEQYKATLEECRDIGRQLSRLVDRIMTLASLDAGNDRIVVERVDAAELAADCATVVRPLAEAHGLRFSAQIDRGAELVTDPDKLREVLNNLLGNAVEYNRPGGSVELQVAAANGHVAFEVRDTGIGMTPEVREKIFERFYRADPSRHATGVHAGLGLAIVKEYVERLGGTITVESEPGAGSAFRVTIPSAHASPNGNGSAARPGHPLPA